MRAHISPGLLLAAALAGCGGSDLVLPGSTDPAELTVVKGDGQTARVGSALPESLVVRVTDAGGRPVVSQTVVFSRDGATGGTVAPDTVQTNADGKAQARWTLGSVAGAQLARAVVPRAVAPPLTVFFTATATAPPPASPPPASPPPPPPASPPPSGGGGGGSPPKGGGGGGKGDGGGGEGLVIHLGFAVQPSNTESGHAITPAVQLAVVDQHGHTVSSASGEVHIDLGQKPEDEEGSKLKGDQTRALASGVAVFDDLRVQGEGSGYTLVASLQGVGSVESNPFRISD